MATHDALWGWKISGLVALLVIVVCVPLHALKEDRRRGRAALASPAAPASFVGRKKCASCHPKETKAWTGSHHDLAMAPATEATVRGDFKDASFEHQGVKTRFYRRDGKFLVYTEGPGGKPGEFEISYTFGVEPLQQYLIRLPGGRLQAFSVAWDVQKKRWYQLYPGSRIPADDWLHWTRGAQNWNGMCAKCHSTNLRKGYDPATRTYDTRWSEIDVSCEACHGPASRHVAWAEIEPMGRPRLKDHGLVTPTRGISPRQQVELCAPCHSRRAELGDHVHGRKDLLDNVTPRLLDRGLYHADGQILDEVYVYGSFVQSKMYQRDVRCSDCHDVHSLKRVKPGNQLCLRCHRADTYDAYQHHFHKPTHEGKPSPGVLCVKCHMPERPYMVVDYRADHSIRVPRPDLSQATGAPNACGQQGCHHDKPLTWVLEAQRKWYGQARRPHYGTTLAAGRAGKPGARENLIRLAGDPLFPPMIRATALSLLGSYPGARSTGALERALLDPEALVRLTALTVLQEPDQSRLVARVAPLLMDPVKAVRTQAANRLAGISQELLKPYQRQARQRALEEYQRTMEYSLDFSFAGMNLGNLYSRMSQPKKAEQAYRRALEVDDLFYPAKVNLATLMSQQGRNREAEKLLRQVVTAHPDLHQAAYNLSLLLVELKRPADALPFLQRAARGMPGNHRLFYNLGLLLQLQGKPDQAEAALRRALGLQPRRTDYIFALADHYLKRGRPADALPLARALLAARPGDATARRLMMVIQRALRSRPPPPVK